jgi:hypothetical protein
MVVLKFEDRDMELEAIGYLAGRYWGRVIKTEDGIEIIAPEVAIADLAAQNFRFAVMGQATYEQMVAPRGRWERDKRNPCKQTRKRGSRPK